MAIGGVGVEVARKWRRGGAEAERRHCMQSRFRLLKDEGAEASSSPPPVVGGSSLQRRAAAHIY